MPIEVDSRKEVLELLKDVQSHYGVYHNHKENCAWAGVAFYAAVIAAAGTVLRDHFSSIICVHRIGLVIAVLLVCGVSCYFIREQFRLRKRAADLVAASFKARTDIVANRDRAIDLEQWSAETSARDAEMQSSHVLPKRILALASELSSQGQGARRALEGCAYALVVGVTIAAVIALCVSA